MQLCHVLNYFSQEYAAAGFVHLVEGIFEHDFVLFIEPYLKDHQLCGGEDSNKIVLDDGNKFLQPREVESLKDYVSAHLCYFCRIQEELVMAEKNVAVYGVDDGGRDYTVHLGREMKSLNFVGFAANLIQTHIN
jgi:hypothetical protein